MNSRWLQLPIDLTLIAIAWWLAFWLRFNLDTPDEFQAMMVNTLPWPLLGFGASLLGWGVYRHIWRYTSVAELIRLVYGVAFAGLLTAAVVLMLRVESFPRSVLLLHPMLTLMMLGAARAGTRLLLTGAHRQVDTGKPLLIVGSVQDAAAALPALRGARLWSPVGIVSPIAAEKGRTLQGLHVLGVGRSTASPHRSRCGPGRRRRFRREA
jgi:FlaA1/EpsC-like NDP-sugar epimerase